MTHPYRLVTLMEILEVSGEAFCRLSSMIGQMIIMFRGNQIPDLKAVASTLGELNREADRLELRQVAKQLQRIYARITNEDLGSPSPAELHSMVEQVYDRMRDELEERVLITLPIASAEYYKQDLPLFGSEVERRFPRLSEDISEAGKCLALNRPTATVFHLMRVMELGVQEFGTKLGIQLASEQFWQVIIDQINKAIRSMDQKALPTKAYAGAASHLYNVKLAWRNEVMHPKQTYTVEEALNTFNSVRIFMRELAIIL